MACVVVACVAVACVAVAVACVAASVVGAFAAVVGAFAVAVAFAVAPARKSGSFRQKKSKWGVRKPGGPCLGRQFRWMSL